MKKTENYAMPYPEQDDYFNVEDFQDMMVSVDNLMKKISDSGSQISSDAEHLYNQTKAQMDNIQKRMNTFTSLKDGSTTGDAELEDIRVAYDGKEYGNAGEAVREQASDIHKALFGAGASIWSKAKSESTKYVAETKGICILNERFTAAGVVTKISRGTFAENESTLNLDRECSAYIVEFEKNPGTVYMPSAETIKIVSTTKIIFEANGNARCWIPVEKGQYLAVDSTATAYTSESNHVPYMLYDQANKTLECRGFGSTGSIEPVDPYSLALEYKLEYDMDDTGLVKQIDANREDAASLKEDLVELSKSVDNSVYTDFVDGEGWNGTVGEKIKTSLYELVSKMSLVNARVGDKFRLVTYGVGGWANRYYELDENLIVLYVHTGSGLLDGVIEISNESTRYLAINKGNSFNFEFYRYNEDIAQNKADIAQNKADIAQNKADISTKISYHYEKGETIGEIKDGLFNINTKTIEATGNIYRCIELDVNLLDNLFLTGVSHNDASSYPFVVFVDANGNVLDIIKGDSKDAKFIDYNIIIKNQDVKKLYINGSDTFIGAYKAKEVDVYERVDGAVSVAATSLSKVADATWYNEKVAEAVIDEQKKNPFVWRSFDKGVVVFTFDDSLSDIDLVESLSEEYGVPVCFSSIPSKMNNVTTATGTNKKVHEVLTIAEEHGNEVLCHSSVALSETSTDEEIYANFVTNKKLLEEYGYSVRGIIEAGSGGGELSFDTKRSEKYLRVMYEYSDHYGRNLGMPQYDTGRTYINRNTQNNHNVVDACERNKTLLIFVTHSITDESTSSINTSESILRDLMAYVKTKDVYLLTFKGVYDMFRSSELENKINQLLN